MDGLSGPERPGRPWINLQGSLANPNLALEAARRGDVSQLPPEGPARVDARAQADAWASGLSAVCITVGHVAGPGDAWQKTCDDLARWRQFLDRPGSPWRQVNGVSDLVESRATGRVGVVLGFQNTDMLGPEPLRVARCAAQGVRVMQLTYNGVNAVGCGCLAPVDTGLTALGQDMVEAMNAQGVLIDLSHAGDRTLADAVQASLRPVIVSHTGCRALAAHRRNLADEDLRRVADAGGVVGLYAMPFLRAAGQPLLEDLVRHIDHALQMAGTEHVGVGTDGTLTAVDDVDNYRHFLGEAVRARRAAGLATVDEDPEVCLFLPDLTGPSQFQRLADALGRIGHGASVIDRVLGSNALRLFGEVWPSLSATGQP